MGKGWGGVEWDNSVTGSLTHASCYATVRGLGLPHIRHATLLYVVLDFHAYVMLRYCTLSWTSTRTSCYAPGRCLGLPHVRHATLLDVVLDFHTYVMLCYVLLDFHACVILGSTRCCERKTAENLWKQISWGLWRKPQNGGLVQAKWLFYFFCLELRRSRPLH